MTEYLRWLIDPRREVEIAKKENQIYTYVYQVIAGWAYLR